MRRAGATDPRCAVHPARFAAGDCPRCARPRCAPDAQLWGPAGCEVCTGALAVVASHPPPTRLERLVRAGLASYAVGVPVAWTGTEYINVRLMSLIVPGLVGLAGCWAAFAAAGVRRPGDLRAVPVIAAVGAVLATALGVRLFGTPLTPVSPLYQVGPPYLVALVGVAAWPVLFGPPRRRRGQGDEEGDPEEVADEGTGTPLR